MTVDILVLVAAVGVLTLLAAVGYYLIERRRDRRRWATYSDYRGGEPKSKVCPSCRVRIYSLRSIRERRCVHCDAEWPA